MQRPADARFGTWDAHQSVMDVLSEYFLDVFLPLLLATIGGAVIGWEREARDKPAGLRTHMMVSLAAAAFMVSISQYIDTQAGTSKPYLQIDPGKVIAGIVGGVGFLGAGSIIEARGKVYGITTAASIWVSAAIGTAAGMKLFSVAFTSVALAIGILLLIGVSERWLVPKANE